VHFAELDFASESVFDSPLNRPSEVRIVDPWGDEAGSHKCGRNGQYDCDNAPGKTGVLLDRL
jgi:hypothetical protein